MYWASANLTITFASTVKVTPLFIVIKEVTIYGLPARFQVVFAAITPETLVEALRFRKVHMTITNRSKNVFFIGLDLKLGNSNQEISFF